MNINTVPDADLMEKVQTILNKKGLDLATEINKYLKKIVDQDTNELVETTNQPEVNLLRWEDMPEEERERRLKIIKTKGPRAEVKGVFQGMIWMSDDFDEPLECMKDYMP